MCCWTSKTFTTASFVHMDVKPIPVVLSTWEKYKSNVETGLIAAACAAAIIIIPCLVYKFRWKPPEKKSTQVEVQKESEPPNKDSPESTVVPSNRTSDPCSSLPTESIKPVPEKEATKPGSVDQNNVVRAAPDENMDPIVKETITCRSTSKDGDCPLVVEYDSAENGTVVQESDSSAYENKGAEILE
ncbi:uncharacterized protein LOC143229225 [Tachypleus tridentatus]|uniref:uncharacterized protein LOC143229225 n=1 Tax=Tachypleus tridentatus TaxID=6853 RepID=UPI003FD103DA